MSDSQKLKDYQQGWLDAAVMRTLPKSLGNSEDYLLGYYHGTIAWREAMDHARFLYDEPLTLILDEVSKNV